MALQWQGGLDQGWRGSLLVVAVLLLRGLPAVLAVRPLLEALRAGAKDVHFLGWFGSIGSTALSLRETGYRGSVGGRQPPHLRLRAGPRGNRHTPHRALRTAVLRRVS